MNQIALQAEVDTHSPALRHPADTSYSLPSW